MGDRSNDAGKGDSAEVRLWSAESDAHAGRHRPRRLRSLEILPTLITLGNLLCGFAAIHFALRAMHDLGAGGGEPLEILRTSRMLERMLPSFLSVSASLILLGMVFDCFDGLIARVTRSTTNFGGQLDSLADVVSFGAAPATLAVAFMTKELASESIVPSPLSEHFLGRAAWVCAAVYVCFAAIRLARFNVEHANAGHDYRTFRGLPSPGAAALITALVLFHDQPGGGPVRGVFVYIVPTALLAAGLLMVSRIPYRRMSRGLLLGRQPFGRFVVLLGVVALFLSHKAPVLLLVVTAYVLSGPASAVLRLARGKPITMAAAGPVGRSEPVSRAGAGHSRPGR